MAAAEASSWVVHPWVAEAAERVRFGVFVTSQMGWPGAIAWARRAEELGLDSVWVGDHPAHFDHDCFVRLAALAQATERVRVGTMVACPSVRGPLLLARQAADVDALSGGRLVLGLGIGDVPDEFAAMGVPHGPVHERQLLLEETTPVVARLLAGETVTVAGARVRVDGARLAAPAVQRPRVPILVAGGGERVTLRQVARHADAANFGAGAVVGDAWAVADVRRKYAVLREHCAAAGRPYDSVLRTYGLFGFNLVASGEARWERWRGLGGAEFLGFTGTPADAVAHLRALVEAGARYFVVWMRLDPETLRLLGEVVVPAVAAG